jgi:hypothetical protein
MRGLKKVAALVISAASIMLAGCDYETDLNILQTFITWNQIGYSADQWLEQYAPSRSEWDKLALVFGYGDDYEGCIDLLNGMAQRFPRARYRCVPAN